MNNFLFQYNSDTGKKKIVKRHKVKRALKLQFRQKKNYPPLRIQQFAINNTGLYFSFCKQIDKRTKK